MTPSVFATPAATFADAQLRAIIERIERLEAEKKTIGEDIADVYAEAKGNGFDVKALRQIVRERRQDVNERAEQETILDTYRRALGMLADTPLGRAATEAATRAPPTRVRGYRPGGNNRMAG